MIHSTRNDVRLCGDDWSSRPNVSRNGEKKPHLDPIISVVRLLTYLNEERCIPNRKRGYEPPVDVVQRASQPLNQIPFPNLLHYLLKLQEIHFCIMDPLNKESANSVIGGPGGKNTPADGTGKS